MYSFVAAVFVVAALLAFVELLWRKKIIKKTNGRALVHILVACWVAFWTLFLSFDAIGLIAILMFVGISLSRALNIFKFIHKPKRWTIGELLFPIAILICSQIAANGAVFAVAMLQLGLADGLASIIGNKTSFKTYKILGQTKSVGGTFVFMIIALGLTVATFAYKGSWGQEAALMLIVLPAITAAAENISVFGLDDITVPLLTVVLLNSVV